MSKMLGSTRKEKNVNYEFVWGNITEELVEEARKFWVAENALPEGQSAVARASQLIGVIRDSDDNLIAVSTAECVPVPRLLNNVFYYFRCFVASHRRREGLTMEMSHKAREHMHPLFLSGECIEVKGFYYSIESEDLEASLVESTRMVGGIEHDFIGTDEKQRRIYVGWFDGAKID